MARNVIEIVINADNNASGVLEGVSSSLGTMGQSITRAGMGLTAMMAPIGILGAGGLRSAANFETTFTEISARTGVVGDELAMLSDLALAWGADTVFSGQQAADAFLQLLTTGMSVEDAIVAMDSVLIGAAASGLDLGTTADRITNIMAGMRLEVDEGTYIIDRLARASGAVGGGMQPMMEAMEASAGTAQTFGIGLDDLIPMLAVWSDAGIRGSEAGTQFRSMMVAMTADTASSRGAWEELGTSLYNADGTMRDMNVVLAEMQVALADKSEEEKSRILKDLAGSYGLAGLSALLASDGLSAMNTRIDESASAQDIADAQMGTFAMTVESLMGSFDALMITTLTPFMNDVLKPMADDLINVVNNVRSWAEENPELTNTIVGIMAGLLVLGPTLMITGMVIGGLGTGVGVLTGAFGLLKGAMLAMFTPFGLVAAGIAAILAGAEMLYPGGLGQMLQDATTTAQQLSFIFRFALSQAVTWIKARFDELLVTLAPVLETLRSIVDFANRGLQAGSNIASSVSNIASSGASIGDIFSAAGNAISWQLAGGRADGGPVSAGETYMVGERGPELFVPNASGAIVPNEALGGVSIGNITINANSVGEGREAMRGALDELMARQRSRGGM